MRAQHPPPPTMSEEIELGADFERDFGPLGTILRSGVDYGRFNFHIRVQRNSQGGTDISFETRTHGELLVHRDSGVGAHHVEALVAAALATTAVPAGGGKDPVSLWNRSFSFRGVVSLGFMDLELLIQNAVLADGFILLAGWDPSSCGDVSLQRWSAAKERMALLSSTCAPSSALESNPHGAVRL